MTTPRSPEVSEPPLSANILHAIRYYVGSGRGLLVLAAVAVIAGLAFNWSWLVAAGVAPFLLTVLPCAVMCALGLCMSRGVDRPCFAETATEDHRTVGGRGESSLADAGTSETLLDCPAGAPENGPVVHTPDLQPEAIEERSTSNA